MKLEDTELLRINFEDDRFRIAHFTNLEGLKRSIGESGLLSPIVVTPRHPSLVIVMGWKRALACRELSLSPIPCSILEESNDLKAFQLAIQENSAMRDFTILEKAVILRKLKALGMEEMDLLEMYLPFLGIPQTLTHLDAYLKMAELDADTMEFIHVKKASYPAIQQLMELNREERAALLPHLRHLGQNKQKELLEFLIEISKRDYIPVLNILESEAIADAIQSETLSPYQKADNIRLLLRKGRYPFFSAQKDAFESLLKKMEWPEKIALDHSASFEGENLSVRFNFKDSAEFKDKVQSLQKIASTNRISEILKSIPDD